MSQLKQQTLVLAASVVFPPNRHGEKHFLHSIDVKLYYLKQQERQEVEQSPFGNRRKYLSINNT